MTGGSGLTRQAIRMTARSIAALRPAEAPYRVPDAACRGLAVRVAPSGLKTYDLAYRIKGGKSRRLSLGSAEDVTLENARARASAITAAARQGQDLISAEKEAARAKQARLSVDALIAEYVARRVKGRLRTAKEIEARLRRSLQTVLTRPAADLRRRDLREVFNLAADAGYPREAEKRRQTVGAMFRWAVSQDLMETDPTAGLAAYDVGAPRSRVLSAEEISKFWSALDRLNFPDGYDDILRLELLTGARCGEVAGMSVEEIDKTKWLWTLPAARSKNKKPRVTPLVGLAREIVEKRLPAVESGFLFVTETNRSVTSSHVGASLEVRRAAFGFPPFTTHDLRRTAATQMVELTQNLGTVGAIVGHESANGSNRILLRHYVHTDLIEQKRAVLEKWDRRLRDLVRGGSDVISYPSRVIQAA